MDAPDAHSRFSGMEKYTHEKWKLNNGTVPLKKPLKMVRAKLKLSEVMQ